MLTSTDSWHTSYGDEAAVLGGGLMGHAIAAVFALATFKVTCVEPDPLARATLQERMASATLEMGAPEHTAAVDVVDDLRGISKTTGIVIEAAPEDLNLKQQLLRDVGSVVPTAVLASNTSVFRIGDVGALVTNPSRVIGTHWWNPPHLIPLVEVVPAQATATHLAGDVIRLLEQIGKLPVLVRRDSPGFVGNRLQHAMWREAMALIDEGTCDAATIDHVVKTSFGLRLSVMGPVENADFVGLDTTLAIHKYVFPALSRSTTPASALQLRVERGDLGAKTGRGFYEWSTEARESAAARLRTRVLELLGRDSPTGDGH